MQTKSMNDIRNNAQNLIYCNHKNAMDITNSSDVSHEKSWQTVRAWAADWRSKKAVAAEIIQAWSGSLTQPKSAAAQKSLRYSARRFACLRKKSVRGLNRSFAWRPKFGGAQ